jgi:hypothetical protein
MAEVAGDRQARRAPPEAGEPSRRTLFALAAALTVTALTGAFAIAGLARHVAPAPAVPQVGQTLTPASPTAPRRVEPGD